MNSATYPTEFVSDGGLIYRATGRAEKALGIDIYPSKPTILQLQMSMSCALWDRPMRCAFAIHAGIGDREVVDYSKMLVRDTGDIVEIVSYK